MLFRSADGYFALKSSTVLLIDEPEAHLSDYAKAHLAKKYLSEKGYEEMWKERALVPNTGEHIACGWFIWDYNGKRYYGHEGGVRGYRTAMFLCPDDDSSYIVLANSSEAPVRRIVEGVIDVDSV